MFSASPYRLVAVVPLVPLVVSPVNPASLGNNPPNGNFLPPFPSLTGSGSNDYAGLQGVPFPTALSGLANGAAGVDPSQLNAQSLPPTANNIGSPIPVDPNTIGLDPNAVSSSVFSTPASGNVFTPTSPDPNAVAGSANLPPITDPSLNNGPTPLTNAVPLDNTNPVNVPFSGPLASSGLPAPTDSTNNFMMQMMASFVPLMQAMMLLMLKLINTLSPSVTNTVTQSSTQSNIQSNLGQDSSTAGAAGSSSDGSAASSDTSTSNATDNSQPGNAGNSDGQANSCPNNTGNAGNSDNATNNQLLLNAQN